MFEAWRLTPPIMTSLVTLSFFGCRPPRELRALQRL
jgi:hypothetical protein